MGVMQDTIADGVSQRRMAQVVMPEGWSKLAGDNGRPEIVAILEEFEEILARLIPDRRQAPIVKHEDVGSREPGQQTWIGAGSAREHEFMEKA